MMRRKATLQTLTKRVSLHFGGSLQLMKKISEQYPKVYLYRRIVQAKIFIDTFYKEKIDLNNISDEAYFSKFHFVRLFKAIYGKTPHQYLNAVRIEKAKLFFQQNTSVLEGCFMVGFDSPSTFSGLFKKLVGKTPSQYVTQYQERQTKMQTSPHNFVPGCYAYMHGWKKE